MLIIAVLAVLGAWAVHAGYLGKKLQASAASAAASQSPASHLADVAFQEGLGFLRTIFSAIASKDKDALYAELLRLSTLAKSGSGLAVQLESFVFGQVAKWIDNPDTQKKLLDFIGAKLGKSVVVGPPAPPASAAK